MRRTILAAACAAAALMAAPSVASAHYYMGKAEARSHARDFAIDRYGVISPGIYCRPQGTNGPEPGYDYHRWVCGWAEDGCGGAVLIYGSKNQGGYWYRVLRGQRCE